jgi:hypothetical protein
MDNSRTQDTAVGPSGVHHLVTPPLATGVVQRIMLVTLAACDFDNGTAYSTHKD